jgi:hypothetical protein
MQKSVLSSQRASVVAPGLGNLVPRRCLSTPSRRAALAPIQAAVATQGTELIKEAGIASNQGTARKQNEDRLSLDVGDLVLSSINII